MLIRPGRLKILSGCCGLALSAIFSIAFCQTPVPNSEALIMGHLNLVLRWSRQWDSVDIELSRPGDEVYIENGRDIAGQVLKLEFQSALAQAELLGDYQKNVSPSGQTSQQAGKLNNLDQLQKRTTAEIQQLQAQLDTVNRQIATARAKEREGLLAKRNALNGQLQLEQALNENLQKISSFVTSENSPGAAKGLSEKILALQRNADVTEEKTAKSNAPNRLVTNPRNEGLIGQIGQMIQLMKSLRTVNRLERDGKQLMDSTREFRAPLLAGLRATLQQSQSDLDAEDAMVAKTITGPPPGATAQSPSKTTLAQQQRAMADLVRRFKLLSNATVPLSQELVLLNQSQSNLDQLQKSIKRDYVSILRTLLIRIAVILIALAVIWLLSELWRRATFRYVRDARRRRQFLVLRRVATGFFMFVVVLLGFVSDFGSLATYAGLITAGIAVALQAIILSIAAYFFLVGRYGVRVGDRVTVVYNGPNSVTGDVIDIGLVRFYMMELAGSGVDMQPTGRICAFPNSVLFQTNPLFKQFPGTEYAWREIALTLGPNSDGQLAEKQLLAVVNDFYDQYRPVLERQQYFVETMMEVHLDVPKPSTRVRFGLSGLEVIARYPVPLRQAGELDDRIVIRVRDFLRANPSINLAPGTSPELRSGVRG